MALPRYLYSVTETLREPLVAGSPRTRQLPELEGTISGVKDNPFTHVARKNGGNQANVEAELKLEEFTSPTVPCNTREVFANDTQRSLSGESTEIHSAASQGPTATFTSSVNTIASSDYVFYDNDQGRTKWEEAALYVREGEDNDKFIHHPTGRWSKLAYTIHHHPAFYISNLVTTILLLLLAFIEVPSIVDKQLSHMEKMTMTTVSGVLEVVFLSFLAVDILLRLIWLQPLHFVQHKRTVLTTIILVVMFVEAITVLIRQQSHFRITRSLRPIFFIDSYLMREVRRVLRHILLCFKPILEILLLMLFTVVYFSLIGYYVFAGVDPTYFGFFAKTYVSLFITLTTANNPDVMMEAYSSRPAAPIFFIIYLVITLYFISNVLLAVVYSTFSDAGKNKFRRLFLHKREALRRAYDVLADPDGIKFHDFLLFMQQYKPRIPEWQVLCIFKALHRDPEQQHTGLSCDDFYSFYEMIGFKWRQVTSDGEDIPWYTHFPKGVKTFVKAVDRLVRWKWFNIVMCVIVFANTIFLIVFSLTIHDANERYEKVHKVLPVSYAFVGIYCVEITLRVIGQGPLDYFGKFWNVVDTVVIVGSLIALVLERTVDPYLVIVRPIKLARLLRLKQRYRDSVNTLVGLVPRLISILIVLLVVYYVFAIIGIECFHGKVKQNCCNTSWYSVGQYYSGNISDHNNTNTYYLNNFNNILRSYVTLFILMVVNNWYIIMEGFASQFQSSNLDELARVYFMSFYVITFVVLQVVITFIVEAFVFKIQATEKRRHCNKHPNSPRCECLKERDQKKEAEVVLEEPDMNTLKYEMTYTSETQHRKNLNHFIRWLRRRDLHHSQCPLKYHGRRLRTKDDIYLYMYRTDLQLWIEEQEKELQQKHNVSQTPPSPLCIRMWRWVWDAFKKILEYIFE